MSHRQLSALRNMPIWMKRCERAERIIQHNQGKNNDYLQLRALRSYMQTLLNEVSEA